MQYIPYFQTARYRVQVMVDLAGIKSGDIVADLGSGDGRILIAFAEKGIEAHGYELAENLIKLAEENINKSQQATRAFISRKNFWHEDLSPFSIITVYGMPDIMDALEKKLQKELKPGARVLLNYYPFPTWKAETMENNIYLYRKKL